MSGFIPGSEAMKSISIIFLAVAFFMLSGAVISHAQTDPQRGPVPGTVPGGPANVPGQGPNDVPGTGPDNVPGRSPTDQVPGGGRFPERDRSPLGGFDMPKSGTMPGRGPAPVTPDEVISEPSLPDAPELPPDMPSSGGNVAPPVISDLPPLPDDPSTIQPELDTDYLTAPVFKDAVRMIADDDAQYVPDQVIVLLRGASGKEAEIDGLGGRHNLDRLDSAALSSLGVTMVVFEIPDERSVPAVVNILAAESGVILSQPNFYYGSLAGENPQYGAVKIGADAVRGKTTGSGITVAVVDTGIDYNHPALDGKIVQKADFVNPGMNGFTNESHGTSVAGIIAASAIEDGGMSGVAPGVSLIAARACWSDPGNSARAVCSSEKLAKAIDFAISNNARIINLSVGGPKDGLIAALIQSAYGSGVTVVAAAGNGGAKGKPVYPAALNEVIAVSATDSGDGLYALSTRGDYIDVAAPGVDILSPAPGGAWGMESGTSQAAAHVSGAVALLLQDYPELSPFQVKHLLRSSAVDLGKTGRDTEFGDGRIDVEKALNKLDSAGEASAK